MEGTTLRCRCCSNHLVELDEIEIHGDICHSCAWGFNSNEWWEQVKKEDKFVFNENRHLLGCNCSKCIDRPMLEIEKQ